MLFGVSPNPDCRSLAAANPTRRGLAREHEAPEMWTPHRGLRAVPPHPTPGPSPLPTPPGKPRYSISLLATFSYLQPDLFVVAGDVRTPPAPSHNNAPLPFFTTFQEIFCRAICSQNFLSRKLSSVGSCQTVHR